jgi:hypothetical protein
MILKQQQGGVMKKSKLAFLVPINGISKFTIFFSAIITQKKISNLLILFALLPLLTAMSALQNQSPEKIPVPEKKYVATFIDQTDMITDCRNISIDGETFLEGKRGSGTNTIPFEIITEVSFMLEGEKLNGTVKLRDGNVVQLLLNKNQRAYGHTKYGTFQIRLADLKKMILSK